MPPLRRHKDEAERAGRSPGSRRLCRSPLAFPVAQWRLKRRELAAHSCGGSCGFSHRIPVSPEVRPRTNLRVSKTLGDGAGVAQAGLVARMRGTAHIGARGPVFPAAPPAEE